MRELLKISLEDAKKIVLNRFPEDNIVSSIDFNDMYVFGIIPKKYFGEKKSIYIKSPVAVDKKTGKTMGFNPLMFDHDSYKLAVETTIRYY